MALLTQLNFTLEHTSPMFEYYPRSDESHASTGWRTATDLSEHFTSMPNASLTFTFFGTTVTMFGSSNASFTTFFDGQEVYDHSDQELPNVLFHAKDTEGCEHRVRFEIGPVEENQVFQFYNATVASPVVGRSRFPVSTSLSSARTHGSWHTKNFQNHFALNTTSDVSVRATREPGDSISFSFRGRAAAVYGHVNASSGLFSVTHNEHVQVVNASSRVPVGETVLYYKDGLSEFNNTTLLLTNLGNGETCFAVTRVQVFAFNSTDGSYGSYWVGRSRINVSAIAGSVIGVTIILVLVIICGILIVRRRRNKARTGPCAIAPFEMATNGAIISSSKKESTAAESNSDEPPQLAIAARTDIRPTVSSVPLSTVERLLLLIAQQMDTVGRLGDASGQQDRNTLPPYPASMRDRSFRSIR